ncbi:MAG: DUF1003 domain-containing protein [Candidatus Woesearchaeota archaeon]
MSGLNINKLFSKKGLSGDSAEMIKTEIKLVEKTLERVEELYEEDLKSIEKVSERIAAFVGTWKFIHVFLLFLTLWIIANVYLLTTRAFDPFPFSFANFLFSAVSVVIAPLILMNQKRAANLDKLRVEMDLKKDIRDLQVDEHSLRILQELQKDIKELKKKRVKL